MQAASTVTRQLPETAITGTVFELKLTVITDDEVGVYAVEEKLPETWTADEISHFGRFDSTNGKIKWGPFLDRQPRTLTARVQIPLNAEGLSTFSGISSFNGASVPIIGHSGITLLNAVDASQVTASLPIYFQPAIPFNASYDARPSTNISVYAVEESLPTGWFADNISHGGRFDVETAKVKWGPFVDQQQRLLTAAIHPSSNDALAVTLHGTGSFDGVGIPIKGSRLIQRIQSHATRALPPDYQRLTSFNVVIHANVHDASRIHAVEDIPPSGWAVSGINEGGRYDAETGKVKWGPFEDTIDRIFQYQVTPPQRSAERVSFSGLASFDGFSTQILGDSMIHPKAGQAIRNLPESFLPGESFDLIIQVFPDDAMQIYAVEETIPADWIVSTVNENGVVDAVNHKIKWGPFIDNLTRDLTVVLLPANTATGAFTFSGTASFDGVHSIIGGAHQVEGLDSIQANRITRNLPSSARAGGSVGIGYSLNLAPTLTVYAAEETIPAGWLPTLISDDGFFDEPNHKIKWGPFFNTLPMQLGFEASIPATWQGEAMFSGFVSFDGLGGSISGTSSLQIVANHHPIAVDDAVEWDTETTLVLSIAKLLANDKDANTDTLEFVLDSLASHKGGTLTSNGSTITYTPPAGGPVLDSFEYHIEDGFGGADTATVSIHPRIPQQSRNILAIKIIAPGQVEIRFAGIPGIPYQIQYATQLNPPNWQTLPGGGQVARNDGTFDYVDATEETNRFYRSVPATP